MRTNNKDASMFFLEFLKENSIERFRVTITSFNVKSREKTIYDIKEDSDGNPILPGFSSNENVIFNEETGIVIDNYLSPEGKNKNIRIEPVTE